MLLLCSGRVAGRLPLLPKCIISRVLFWREHLAAHVLVGSVRRRAAAQPPAQVAPYVCCAANTARAQAWLPLQSQAGRARRWQHMLCILNASPHDSTARATATIPRLARAVLPVSACAGTPALPPPRACNAQRTATHKPRVLASYRPQHPCSRPPARPHKIRQLSRRSLVPRFGAGGCGAVWCGVVWCAAALGMHACHARACQKPAGKTNHS